MSKIYVVRSTPIVFTSTSDMSVFTDYLYEKILSYQDSIDKRSWRLIYDFRNNSIAMKLFNANKIKNLYSFAKLQKDFGENRDEAYALDAVEASIVLDLIIDRNCYNFEDKLWFNKDRVELSVEKY